MALTSKQIRARRGLSLVSMLVILVAVCAAAGGIYYFGFAGRSGGVDETMLIMQTVERGPFDHVVLEQGEVESSSNTDVVCQVKARGTGGTSILWVIDEGTRVEEGEKLVELDSSQLETEMKQQKIVVNNARASLTSADATLEQARIARQEYLEGVYRTEEAALESEIAVAQQELRKAQLNLQSTEKMVAKGLVNALQLEGDQFGVANARNQLDAANGKLRVLQNLTKQKMLVQYDSDIESAVAAREAARSTLTEEEDKLADIESQIEACVMYAPAAGVVVHANEYSRRGGDAEFVVEAGATVRERQVIIRLPDPDRMQVKASINESRITLVREGMPAKIRVDAVTGLELRGRVKKVNRYAEPGSFWSGNSKEYGCVVEILDPPETIRTGMTAEVRIFVDQQRDALLIPVQGIYEHYGQTFSLVREPDGGFETRKINVGATDDTVATVTSGLDEGDSVVLNLRSHLDLMKLPEPTEADLEMMEEGDPSQGAEIADRDGPSNAGGGGRPAAGGGGMPSAAQMVDMSFSRYDTDGDDVISAEEAASMDEMAKRMTANADSNGDGNFDRREMTAAAAKIVAAIKQRMQAAGGGGFGGN